LLFATKKAGIRPAAEASVEEGLLETFLSIPRSSRVIGSQFSAGTPFGCLAATWISMPPDAFNFIPAF